MNNNKTHWVTRLAPALAFVAGIIMASVGGIMTISSSLKLAFFESEQYNMVNVSECRYDFSIPMKVYESAPTVRSESEIQDCITERKDKELERFQDNKKRDIIDGISALFVGGILILLFRNRRKK